MARKLILDIDPGVSDAMAVCLAFAAPELDVVALTATGGAVSPRQASRNVQALVEHLDPPHWPRVGAADESQPLRTDNRELWGVDGFCGTELGVAELHQQHPSTKVLSEEIRSAPGEVTILAGGPLSNLASLLRLEPDLATQIGHLVIVGGTHHGPGDVTAAAEFNMFCDAQAAQVVFQSPVTKTLLPLDLVMEAPMTVELLTHMYELDSPTGQLLRRLLPSAFQAFRQRRGMEGILVPEVVAVAAVMQPGLLTTERLPCEVETGGNLTHGATVIDRRPFSPTRPNVDVAVEIDALGAVDVILRGLMQSSR